MKNSNDTIWIFFKCTLFSSNSCTGGSQTVIFMALGVDSCLWCSEGSGGAAVKTLVRTGFPPSGALGLRYLEYTQISACVRAPSRPMMCFPTNPL